MFRRIRLFILSSALLAAILLSLWAAGLPGIVDVSASEPQLNPSIFLPLSFGSVPAESSNPDINIPDAEIDSLDAADVEDLSGEDFGDDFGDDFDDELEVEAAWWGNNRSAGNVVVANRASGTISVIDVATDQVIHTLTLPGPLSPQPMYVNYSRASDQVFVGDRTHSQIVVYDADDFSEVGTIPAGAGVFHMWSNLSGKQLWVNNDIDNTITVIDTRTHQVLNTIALPADLVAQNGKPHDVLISENNRNVFVSMIGLDGPNDYVLKYDARTYQETARTPVGKDPHLSASRNRRLLYVPTQQANEVAVLRQRDLSLVESISVPAAHGAGMRADGQYFYVTNIAGGGPGGLVTIDVRGRNANTVVGTTDTPFATPHNIAVTNNGRKVYVTHSGDVMNKVSVYSASRAHPVPVMIGTVTVGFNPFGLDFVP